MRPWTKIRDDEYCRMIVSMGSPSGSYNIYTIISLFQNHHFIRQTAASSPQAGRSAITQHKASFVRCHRSGTDTRDGHRGADTEGRILRGGYRGADTEEPDTEGRILRAGYRGADTEGRTPRAGYRGADTGGRIPRGGYRGPDTEGRIPRGGYRGAAPILNVGAGY